MQEYHRRLSLSGFKRKLSLRETVHNSSFLVTFLFD